MTPAERRATASLASIYGLRLLGMFVILPVFALYAQTLPGGASHTLIGVALGAYGLTQAILQIPFGWASDRWGRKPVIYMGLFLFAVGSFIAAWGTSIGWVILGRCLQGAGAISAAVIALAADLTRMDEEMDARHRELFQTVLAPTWEYGVEAAVDVTLLSRYYERFADHAVTIAKRVVYVVTGEPYATVDPEAIADAL